MQTPPWHENMDRRLVENHDDVRQMSIDAMSLLRQGENKLYQQAKQLTKINIPLACTIFTTEIDGWTLIHACAHRGSKKLVKVMLRSGVDVNLPMGKPDGLPGHCTLLHVAADAGHVKMMDYLISRGSAVNARDSYGRTPLFYARRSSKKEAIKKLLENNAESRGAEAGGLSYGCHTPQPKWTNFCFFLFKL